MPTALVTDDVADVRRLIRRVLEPAGYVVEEASSGLLALAMLASPPRPDVVVLDVQMPEMDGWQTLAAIRSEPTLGNLPVVLCTVKAGPDDIERAWLGGCDGYVVKPFDIGELLAQVDLVVKQDEEERQLRRALMLAQASRDTKGVRPCTYRS